MTDSKDLKDVLQRDMAALRSAREELRLQLHLAKADVLDEWKKLEDSWGRVETELKRVGDHTKEPVKELGSAARSLLDELKRGYARIKAQLPPGR